jgi:hypothetical protein
VLRRADVRVDVYCMWYPVPMIENCWHRPITRRLCVVTLSGRLGLGGLPHASSLRSRRSSFGGSSDNECGQQTTLVIMVKLSGVLHPGNTQFVVGHRVENGVWSQKGVEALRPIWCNLKGAPTCTTPGWNRGSGFAGPFLSSRIGGTQFSQVMFCRVALWGGIDSPGSRATRALYPRSHIPL